MKIPKTTKTDLIEILHGQPVSDPYRWLENVENKEVQDWLDEQNSYTRSILDELPYRENLRKEFAELFRDETIGVPYSRNGLYFFMKRNADQDLSALYVKSGLNGEAKVLVDPNRISKEKGFPINLSGFSISNDGSLVSYRLSESANDKSNLYIMEVDSGKILTDTVPGDLYPYCVAWSSDNSGFWYTRRKEKVPEGEEKFHKKIFYHKIGSHYSEDSLVFGENHAKEDHMDVYSTKDGKYLVASVVIASEKYRRSENYVLDLENQEKGFTPIVKDIKDDSDVYFETEIHRGYVYIKNNYKAPKWKIDRILISDIEKGMDAWETIIPEKEDGVVDGFSVGADKLFVLTLENVHSVLREYSLDGKFKKEVSLPGLGSASCVFCEDEGVEGFFSFDSFTYPYAVFRIDFKTGEVSLYDQIKIKTDISGIESEQIWYKTRDKTDIPMFLIHKKGIILNSESPTVLSGYGGFGISVLPQFMKVIIPFIQRGGVFALANIRGGGEFGEKWHKDGTKDKKQNVFDDFIVAAEWLINNKYTNSNKLAISGGSNGGLLVGAVMTQRPELIKTVIMSVPVVDMLRYHLFHGGRHWIPDYGCAEEEDAFKYLLAYSPYHNIKDKVKYPSTFIATSDQDDRVHPGQAFKMAARLQESNSSDNPIILRVERKAGHSGAADISRYLNKAVDEWSFIFSQLGV